MTVTIAFNPNESIVDAPHYYFGLSTDTKPTVATPTNGRTPKIGDYFLEHNTGALYITHDGTNWVLDSGDYNPDDLASYFGTGGTVKILYETADANANALIFVAPEGGATDVPVFIFGDASIDNVDLTWFNGVTEPTLAIVNDAADAYVSLDAGDDGVAGSKGLYFKAAADEDIELINLSVTGTPRIYWDESESLLRSTLGWAFDAGTFIGDTANAFMTLGLTINQGAADDEAIGLKSTDIAHGVTDLAETDTYGLLRKLSGTDGALDVLGFADTGTPGIRVAGVSPTDDTTKTTAGTGVVRIQALKKSGTTVVDSGADGNLAVIASATATRFIFDVEGSGHADVGWVAYDKYDDLSLIRDMETELLATENRDKTNRRHALEAAGIIGKDSWHFEKGKFKAMINFTKLAMLHHGALLQVHQKIMELEAEQAKTEARLLAIGG